MSHDTNPFPETDPDRHSLWEMMVRRDIDAFLAADWGMLEDGFVEEGFMGIDGRRSGNPDSWRLTFPDLASYRETWLEQAACWADSEDRESLRQALFKATTLRDIEIRGDSALLHKKFDGDVVRADGGRVTLVWQTLYRCRKVDDQWRIAGFTGYLPNPMGNSHASHAPGPPKQLPEGASQHITAGPYSPVLVVDPGKLVVISGQAALNHAGEVIGNSIEEQTRHTIDNCAAQLASAGCTLTDVFKVNIFMTDLGEWPRVNAVYQEMIPEPRPVRTAVQTGLLMTLRIEIEMWAVKRS